MIALVIVLVVVQAIALGLWAVQAIGTALGR